jgi:hypothetical protein
MPPKKAPHNKMISDDEFVTVSLELKFKKSSIPVENAEEKKWREDIWQYILLLKSKEEDIALNAENKDLHFALKELYGIEWDQVNAGILSYACMLAMDAKKNEDSLKQLKKSFDDKKKKKASLVDGLTGSDD